MATTATKPKDKPSPGKLTPRPTAASAARAARNAMNRNLVEEKPRSQRLSPTKRQVKTPTPKLPKTTPTPAPANPESLITPISDMAKCEPVAQEGTLPPQDQEFSPAPDVSQAQEETSYVIEGNAYCIEEVSEPTEIPENQQEPKHTIETIIEENKDVNAMQEDPITDLTVTPGSRPKTPQHEGRPATPKSVHSYRNYSPNTPPSRHDTQPSTPAADSRASSRPTTPAHQKRPSTGNLPRIGKTSRPHTPTSCNSAPINRNVPQPAVIPVSATFEDDHDIKTKFAAKQRQFQSLKKELDIKQQAVLEAFNNLQKLNELLSSEGSGGGEGFQLQELVVFNVGDWTREEVAQLCKDAALPFNNDRALELLLNSQIDESIVNDLEANIIKVPVKFADLCLQAFSARQELLDWIKELIKEKEMEENNECMERISQLNAQGLEFCDALANLKASAENAVATITQISRTAFQERCALISVGESLVREVARLRQDLDAQAVAVKDLKGDRAENEDKNSQDVHRQLEEERGARIALKDKLASTEVQLKQTRARVNKMDRQLREAETTIVSLTSTVKTLEDQSRQREVQLEARARKLKESLKTGEVANSHIAQQRDALLAEIQVLKEQLESTTTQYKTTTKEMNKEINDLKTALQEQRVIAESAMEKNKLLEDNLHEIRAAFDDYKTRHPEIDPNAELPTEREIDLWAELQATKDTLRITEDEVTACKREKVRFLETLAKISESENKIGMQQKLAAELLSKEEIIGKMQIQIRELTKNMKLNEQKVVQYEQYVRDLQAHNRAVANCKEAPNGIKYEDLQQEIMTLKMNLLDAVHKNEELTETLTQKEQQLEQQDKTSRAQARIIKVREELINLLKNKETEQSMELSNLQQDLENRMKIVDKVNKQIAAKADEIQELFVTLENKQQQIHRLEKIVLALEEQQRRAQAQRTRHEEKIAALEHELAGGARRERKFLFF